MVERQDVHKTVTFLLALKMGERVENQCLDYCVANPGIGSNEDDRNVVCYMNHMFFGVNPYSTTDLAPLAIDLIATQASEDFGIEYISKYTDPDDFAVIRKNYGGVRPVGFFPRWNLIVDSKSQAWFSLGTAGKKMVGRLFDYERPCTRTGTKLLIVLSGSLQTDWYGKRFLNAFDPRVEITETSTLEEKTIKTSLETFVEDAIPVSDLYSFLAAKALGL